MPTVISHSFVAAGLAPVFRGHGVTLGVACLGAVCAVAPDLDVVGFRVGVPYEAMLGHRGLSHSLFFAAALAMLLTLGLRFMRSAGAGFAVFLYMFFCAASHGFLDALTDGGLGVAFFAPFSNHRFFFPWQPIAVSPLSPARFLSGRGVHVLRSELVWVVAPCLVLGVTSWLMRARPGKSAAGRARRRKSPWNLLLIPAVAGPWLAASWFSIVGLGNLHRSLHPDSSFAILPVGVSGILMAVASVFTWLAPAMILGNILVAAIPAARRALDREAASLQAADLWSANRSLLRIALIMTPAAIAVALIGAFMES